VDTIFHFMARHVDHRFDPDPTGPPRWVITGDHALLDWSQFLRHSLRPSLQQPGKEILVIRIPPPLLPLIEELHAKGWRRGGWWDHGVWEVYAYLRQDQMEIRICGFVGEQEAGDRDTMHAFWGDPPPKISRRKSFKGEYDEWNRKNREDEW
jgi:hypothetical protein